LPVAFSGQRHLVGPVGRQERPRRAAGRGPLMAAGSLDDQDEGITGINVTPLVDICLVLLIIFMVTATYIVKETIEVELPRAAHGGETVKTTFALIVTKDGKQFLNGQETNDDGIVRAVVETKAKGEEVQAIVGA